MLLQLFRRNQLADDLVAGQFAVADRGHQIIFTDEAELRCHPLHFTAFLKLAVIEGVAPEILLRNLPRQRNAPFPLLGLDPGADLVLAPGSS